MKFNRQYECIITNKTTNDEITIKDLTCDFNIKKGLGSGLNNSTFKFFNLSPKTRG